MFVKMQKHWPGGISGLDSSGACDLVVKPDHRAYQRDLRLAPYNAVW